MPLKRRSEVIRHVEVARFEDGIADHSFLGVASRCGAALMGKEHEAALPVCRRDLASI
ncbi:hypothetical protein [Phyllobacterium endophyticum]|uniref:hypothetical protein n=1 Tax=Phyllobacterium endophyticum TaxID=1149773 RepID=UPI001611FAE2|nr:hypothetical protein [Phyllobacterium endophyticum]